VIAIIACYHLSVGQQDFLLRLDADTRARLQEASRREGLPMSQIVRQGLEMRLNGGEAASSAAMRDALKAVTDILAKLSDGWCLVPPEAPPGISWDSLLRDGKV
jgi:predicted DNA-binding protein